METPARRVFSILALRGGGGFEFQSGNGPGASVEDPEDPQFQIRLLEEAFDNFHRYFFIMPLLAQFELEVHQRIELGQGVTADDMNAIMADLYAEGYGSEMQFDRDRTRITWATFSHLYQDYYVYQYSTGISKAHACRIECFQRSQRRRRVSQLPGAGSSVYPLDALKMAASTCPRLSRWSRRSRYSAKWWTGWMS